MHQVKKLWRSFLVSLLILISVLHFSYSREVDTFSFHGTTSGDNSNWYIVKFYCRSPCHIDEIFANFTYSTGPSRNRFEGIILTNLSAFYYIFITSQFHNKSDIFIHVNFLFFNYTYNHLSNSTASGTAKIWGHDKNLSTGTWYLICLNAPTKENKIEIWINGTGEASFLGTAEGNTSFIYAVAEKFLGNLNIKCNKILLTIKGKKEIEVNNSLIAFYIPAFRWGIESIKCTDPTGNTKRLVMIDLGRLIWPIDSRDVILAPIIDIEGKWVFESNLFLFGLVSVYSPLLVGADIKLP